MKVLIRSVFPRATIFDPFSTHQDTRIPRSIDVVVWIQGEGTVTVRGRWWRGEAWGRESRERSSKSAFLCRLHPHLPFSLTPCLYPMCAIPLRFLHLVLAGRPRPHVFPALHIRPPVSLSSPGAILLAPLRTIRVIRTPLDISIRHLLGSGCSPRIRERNLRARGMNSVKRRSFYQYRRQLFLVRQSISLRFSHSTSILEMTYVENLENVTK